MNIIIGSTVFRALESADTMGWAREHCKELPDGTVFIAEKVTQARGRQGRSWIWQPGQLAYTLVLKPALLKKTSPKFHSLLLNHLNMALALSIVKPFTEWHAGLKWPNDFYIDNKKLGGMIIEVIWKENSTPQAIIVGFALNIYNTITNDHPFASKAISLCMVSNDLPSTSMIEEKLFSSLTHWYHLWNKRALKYIFQQWKHHQLFKGTSITTHLYDGTHIIGTLIDFKGNGDMMLKETASNKLITLPFHLVQEITT